MKPKSYCWRRLIMTAGLCTVMLTALALSISSTRNAQAASLLERIRARTGECIAGGQGCVGTVCSPASGEGELGGAWYWLRSPEEEKRVTMATFNRYCIRCHGVDGRGVWDIPGIPDFTNAVWQGSRTDPQIVRIIVEGRGAVMPQFRGTLSLEEAWAMARYLRTFLPGTETPRPVLTAPAKPAAPK